MVRTKKYYIDIIVMKQQIRIVYSTATYRNKIYDSLISDIFKTPKEYINLLDEYDQEWVFKPQFVSHITKFNLDW